MRERRVTLSIDSRLENVALVGTAIHKMSSAAGLSHAAASWMELCVVEAVNNCIKHAYQQQPGHPVEIVFTSHCGRIQIDVCDCGAAMDPQQLRERRKGPAPFDPSDVGKLPVSGMGLSIILKGMDAVEYHKVDDKNILTMVKRLTRPREAR